MFNTVDGLPPVTDSRRVNYVRHQLWQRDVLLARAADYAGQRFVCHLCGATPEQRCPADEARLRRYGVGCPRTTGSLDKKQSHEESR